MDKPTVVDGKLSYSVWAKSGGMLVNRDCLDVYHPSQTYNHLKNNGINPEDFGIKHPLYGEFEGKDRSSLINEIVKLRRELSSMLGSGFF